MLNLFKNRSELQVLDSLKDTLQVIIIQSTATQFTYMNPEGLNKFRIDCLEDLQYFQRKQFFADNETYHYVKMKLSACGKIQGEKFLFKRTDQSNFWGLLTSIERIVNGEVIYDEVIVDISREIDQEHKLTEKTYLLEKVSSELDRFIYSASHDLRAPVSTMLGLLSLMKVESKNENDKYISFLEDSLLKLDVHIRKLSLFSKITNERMAVQAIDMHTVITETVKEFAVHENFEKVKLKLVVAPKSTFNSDYAKVNSILFQLIKNAYDFADLSKSEPFLSINVIDLPDEIRLEMLDNGIGIEDAVVDNVFKMFFRGSTQSRGAGLGLYLVREALTRVQGTIELQSDLGKGTSIVVRLPKHQVLQNSEPQKNY